MALCGSFADQAAIALENARLFAQNREQERRLVSQNERLERLNAQLVREAAAFAEEAEAAMRRLVSRLTATRLYRALLESYAAELGARMTAMESATKNAEEMIDRLTVDFNRARQANITAELLDIVAGAEGLC